MISEKVREATKKNDLLIEEIVNSPLFDIKEDGSIQTKISLSGRVGDYWRDIPPKLGKNLKQPRMKFRRTSLMVSRIIYRKFVGELDYNLAIKHKDKNKLNNSFDNLELK